MATTATPGRPKLEADAADLEQTLRLLAQSLLPAAEQLAQVRHLLSDCWPVAPSARDWTGDSRGLWDSAMRLVAGGPWIRGELYEAMQAANSTLDAHGVQPPPEAVPGRWSLGGVDPNAQRTPSRATAAALRAALPAAEAVRDRIHRQLDDVMRAAPPDEWLPAWDIGDARTYIDTVRWQAARTMPHAPHEFTVRDWRPELRSNFLAFAQQIQSQGELKTWREYVHAYLRVDGFDYWTMGWRVPETTVINRAPSDADEAARPLPTPMTNRLRAVVERELQYRRSDGAVAGQTGILDRRLRALLVQSGHTRPPD